MRWNVARLHCRVVYSLWTCLEARKIHVLALGVVGVSVASEDQRSGMTQLRDEVGCWLVGGGG